MRPLRAVFESLTVPGGDAEALEFSRAQYRTALGLAGVSLWSASKDDFPPATDAWILHAVDLAQESPAPDSRVPADLPWIAVEPRLPAGDAAPIPAPALRRMRLAVSTSARVVRRLRDRTGAAERIAYLPPFCDLSPYVAARRGRDSLRGTLARRLGIPPASPWLLAVGGEAQSAAGLSLLARALGRLVMLDWHLLVSGPVAYGSPGEAALLRLPRQRVSVQREGTAEERDALYAACDMLLWPDAEDAGVRHLLRAQASGLAVVSVRAPGADEIVQDGLTGRLVPAGNAESFANCTGFLLRQPAFRASFCAKAIEKMIEHHDVLSAGRSLRQLLADAGL